MKTEKSCGAVVFTREGGRIRYVIIRSREGVCGLPKGHMEGTETEQETTLREIAEYRDQAPVAQESGLSSIRRMEYETAIEVFQFDSSKRILRQAHSALTGRAL